MKDFGYANGWTETPDIVKDCDHEPEVITVGRCLRQYSCTECDYTYLVDSSD